ncbi:MAG: hydrogenase 2 cytochrome b type component [Pseudomonadota bacterium]|jgi:Ni/Fe-hydrogenase subunit HybB-like protein
MSAHADHAAPVGGRILTVPFLILGMFALIAAYFLILRFIFGLEAAANINNGYPWGIWVTMDVVVGTAFGCGGFVMAFLVYILNKGKYHPLIRPAVMAGLFGYTLGGMAVFFDLGRYWQMYNVFLPWYMHFNSVMLEVALCVATYVVVLWIEFTPVFLEKIGFNNLKQKLEKVLFFFIGLGVLLPVMHQSSLGTMMLGAGYKLHPLWNTVLLPLLFLSSAIIMGYSIVIFESIFAAAGLKRPQETHILAPLSNILWWLLLFFLAVRIVDLLWRGVLPNLDWQGFWFLVELALFVIPLAFLSKNHQTARVLFLSGFCLLLAGTLYRINVYLIGFTAGTSGWNYFPSVPEILVTIGVFSFEIMLYLIFVKKLPVLASPQH